MHEGVGGLQAQTLDRGRLRDHAGGRGRYGKRGRSWRFALGQRRLGARALRLDLPDLPIEQLEPREAPADRGQRRRRELLAFRRAGGLDGLPSLACAGGRDAGDAVERKQAADVVEDRRPRSRTSRRSRRRRHPRRGRGQETPTGKARSRPGRPRSSSAIDGMPTMVQASGSSRSHRPPGGGRSSAVGGRVRRRGRATECSQEHLRIEPIGLGPAMPAPHGDARWMDDVGLEPVLPEHAGWHEAVAAVSGLAAHRRRPRPDRSWRRCVQLRCASRPAASSRRARAPASP